MLLILPIIFAIYLASSAIFMPPGVALAPVAQQAPVAHVHYLAKGVLQVNPDTLATRFIPYGRGIEDRRKNRA